MRSASRFVRRSASICPDYARGSRAFTLIEVLVVVAIIALLVAILLPSLAQARELAHRTGCLANMHGMGQAMTFYSEDHQQNYFMFNGAYNFATGGWSIDTIGGDSAVALALDMRSIGKPGDAGYDGNTAVGSPSKKYIRNWDTLICPATKNKIRFAKDLNNNADNRDSGPGDGRFGHSYEFWNGFQKQDFAPPGPCQPSTGGRCRLYTGSTADSDGDGFPDCLKRPKMVVKRGAAYVILVVDGDDATVDGDANNFPDSPLDNHGNKGWNMLFADMRANWITREKTYQTLNRSDMDISAVPMEYRR
jgi:prepilin-type N-terminal cleavage/methylation domain-containing protein